MTAPNTKADLTTPAGLDAYLAPTQFAASDIQTLSGGHSGFTYRVVLEKPEAGGEKSVVVKHILGYASANQNWVLSAERMRFEHAALDAIARSGLSTPESTVQVPRVLHYDPETNTLVMTDLTPARTLSTVLVEAFEAGTIKSVSAQIGAALGDFMGRFHKWGSEQDNARTLFLENTTSRETVLAIRYQLMIMTAEKYGMKKAWMDEMVQDGMKDANRGGSVIAMADFWFDNILVSMEPELRIYIIDWETARCARPELDVAHFATAAHSLAHVYPSAHGSFVLMQHFMQSYNIHFAVDEVQIGLSAGRDVMSFGVMMPWIRHRQDRVKEEIAQCGLELLECARGRDVAGVRNNVVVRDMYAGVDI